MSTDQETEIANASDEENGGVVEKPEEGQEPETEQKDEPGEPKPRENRGKSGIGEKMKGYRSEIAELRRQLAERDARDTQSKDAGKELKLEDFDNDWDKYNRAQTEKTTKETFERLQRESAEKAANDEYAQRGVEVIEAGQAKYADFDDKVKPLMEFLHGAALDMAAESEVGEDILYVIGSDPAKVRELNGLKGLQLSRAILTMENEIKASALKKVTNAPDPAFKNKGSSSRQKTPDEMTPEEYQKWRFSRLEKRGGY